MTEGEARALFEESPRDPWSNYAVGRVLSDSGRYDEAEEYLRRAVDLSPSYDHRFGFSLALCLLSLGNYEEGFLYYESRPRSRAAVEREGYLSGMGLAQWAGEDLTGKSIVLTMEQGIGDNIQFSRLISRVLDSRPDLVRVWADTAMVSLLETVEWSSRVEVGTTCYPDGHEFHYYCSLDSLPLHTGLSLRSVPPPLSFGPPEKSWALPPNPRVGVAWMGNPAHPLDALRSIPTPELAPIFRVSGVNFVSLQQRVDDYFGFPMSDEVKKCATLADTASLIRGLDLVVSVDTAVAHLAGSLGKPVWLLNRTPSEWRWMADREDSLWYPTMRIFRQAAPGDWSGVLERAALSLATLRS